MAEQNTIEAPAAEAAAHTGGGYELKECNDFNIMGLSNNLLRGIISFGYETPSPIQAKAIIPLMEGHDVLAQAQSGTGKTGAFCIGSIAQIDPAVVVPQVLIFSHTRELAEQTYTVASHISNFCNIKVHLAVGGTPLQNDIRAMESGVHMLIGTPGRIAHLIKIRKLNPATIKRIIIDEADHMLEDRFKDQISEILAPEPGLPQFSKDVKIGLFSATLPTAVRDFALELMPDPVETLVPAEELTLDGIQQYFVEVPDEAARFLVLEDIYTMLNVNQLIIFVNSVQQAESLADRMKKNGHVLQYIHGKMTTEERNTRMKDFRTGKCRVLISTDLLARGIDVQQVSVVFNYEMPQNRENYIHRIGRSGRFGRKGIAINIVTPAEHEHKLNDIRVTYNTKIEELTGDVLSSAHTFHKTA